MLSSILLLLAADSSVQAANPQPLVEPSPREMNQREIRAFNAHVARDHPFYIRCVSSMETGSLSKRNYSCRTNRQWTLADETGNQNARETYGAMQSKAASGQ